MLPCCKRNQIAPAESAGKLLWDEVSENRTMAMATSLGSTFATMSPSPVSAPLPLGLTTHRNDYKVLQSVGVGCYGLANILLVCHKPTGFVGVSREIDLETFSAEKIEEIQHELQTSQFLSHQNIVSYFCSFVIDSKLWTVQHLMHYGSCADIMHSVKHFNNGFHENVISVILRYIIKAVKYLHSLGYVHRSIRAKHFLINESGVVKLSGLRSMVSMIQGGSRKKTIHGHFPGTNDNICWLSPEVLAQDISGYSYLSDIYSIGISALELATGEAPFAGLPLTEIMMLKLRGHPPMLLKRQDNEDPMKNFSKTFFKVVNLCVNPDPTQRPDTAKLLTVSFLKSRKKSNLPSLKVLLLPVVPLDPSQLADVVNQDYNDLDSSDFGTKMSDLAITDD